ncbi:hypothetical protein JCM19296_789 [Nonlabens ulvanivorans]|uniref:Uncharacterized protein n=1 Tax=Nonlabens ulvanivorans TaxID=906888 RepID=A0A081D8G5_NONUL|nr:hypothetical protein JCM19296_789 [Nonlabens ulvanivorans]
MLFAKIHEMIKLPVSIIILGFLPRCCALKKRLYIFSIWRQYEKYHTTRYDEKPL